MHNIGDLVYRVFSGETQIGTVIGYLKTTAVDKYYQIRWISTAVHPVSTDVLYDDYTSVKNEAIRSAQELLH